MIKGVLFDMDGTLTDTNFMHASACDMVLRQFGVHMTQQEMAEKYLGKSAKTIFRDKLEGQDYDLHDCMDNKAGFLKEIVDQMERVGLIPGIIPFLTWLKEQGILLGVATGSDHQSMNSILGNAGIKGYFDFALSAEECGQNKPAPDVYLAGIEKMGFDKSEILAFEDSISGVTSAKAAGLFCIGLETTTKKNLLNDIGVDMIVKDYRDILVEVKKDSDYLNKIIKNKT